MCYKYYNCINIYFVKMKILNFKDLKKEYNLKNDTMNESQLQKD